MILRTGLSLGSIATGLANATCIWTKKSKEAIVIIKRINIRFFTILEGIRKYKILCVERGLFPLPVSFDSEADFEEERRLFYVGITRTKERLHISYALQRARYGSFSGGASLFVNELPFEILDIEAPEHSYLKLPLRNQSVHKPMEYEDYAQEFPDYEGENQYRIGSYVRHPSFGRGKITACSGSGDRTTLTIKFGNREIKIRTKYGKLVPA